MANTTVIDATRSGFADYYNRVSQNGQWLDLRFRASRPLQSAELNEVQTLFLQRLKAIGDSIYRNGTVVDGCVAQMIGGAGVPNITIHAGSIYFAGGVGVLPDTTMQIPMIGQVSVGIRYRELEISETDDTSLRDPAIGSGNYQEAGACRRISQFCWGWVVDDNTHDVTYDYSQDVNWTFFPIYQVIDGTIVVKESPAVNAATLDLIARYDRESNGNYVVSGLGVNFIEELETQYRFDISSGVANIRGYKVGRNYGERMVFTKDPNVLTVTEEPHQFNKDVSNGNKCIVWFNRAPMALISRLTVVKQKQVQINRAPTSGGSDELPDATVLNVIRVFQGNTTYARPADYTVQGDNINWSPSGAEPAPGSAYVVEYTYQVEVVVYGSNKDACIVEVNTDYMILVGLVEGSQLSVDYTYKLPRVDLVVLNQDGSIERVPGIPQRRNPVAPHPGDNQIGLAEISYDWVNPPQVLNNAIRAIKMFELEKMREDIETLYDLSALSKLRTDISLTDSASKHGIFVDSFANDNLRDQGETQSAACVNGLLMLPIDGSIVSPNDSVVRASWKMLPFTLDPVLVQPFRTNTMRVNPYQVFDPIPGIAKLIPAVDRWVVYDSVWTSPITQVMHANIGRQTIVQQSVELVFQSASDIPFMRVRSVGFEVTGFGPGETLQQLTFDNVDVTPS